MVKERLGHLKLSTTEKYLHSLSNADETALAALDKIRSGQGEHGSVKETKAELAEANAEIARLKAVIADKVVAEHLNDKRGLRPA